jgi:hypothetical protein
MFHNQQLFTSRGMIRTAYLFFLFIIGFSWNVQAFATERPQRVKGETISPPHPPAPTILSIIPAQGEPGAKITIFGSGFSERINAYLGSIEIPARVTEGKQLEFTIPTLEAGLYALYLKNSDGTLGRAYNFTVLALRPTLRDLSPSQINSCAEGREREITAQGHNFNENSMLLLDGAVVRSRFISSEAIAFSLPQIPGGLHQIMVKNGPENASTPVALTIETKPEVSQVSIGSEFVNYYELIIEGKNFQQNSSIYVDGQRIGGRGGQEITERDRLVFVDCTKLIYLRHPYSPAKKDFRLQVLNPGGEGSQVVNVTAP